MRIQKNLKKNNLIRAIPIERGETKEREGECQHRACTDRIKSSNRRGGRGGRGGGAGRRSYPRVVALRFQLRDLLLSLQQLLPAHVQLFGQHRKLLPRTQGGAIVHFHIGPGVVYTDTTLSLTLDRTLKRS